MDVFYVGIPTYYMYDISSSSSHNTALELNIVLTMSIYVKLSFNSELFIIIMSW